MIQSGELPMGMKRNVTSRHTSPRRTASMSSTIRPRISGRVIESTQTSAIPPTMNIIRCGIA